jgi:hypothetical protein
LDPKDYEALLASIEQMIEISLRGNRRGNHFQILGGLEKTAQEHDRPYNGSDDDSGDKFLDANAGGDREGCRGLKPERSY